MIYDLRNVYDIEKFNDTVKSLIEQRAVVTLTKKHPRRSVAQNAYLHLLLGWFACEYGCTMEQAKVDFYKRECNKNIFEVERTNKMGKKIIVLRSSSSLSTDEMSTTIDRFRNWSSSVAGIYLPEANEDKFLMYIQNEIERNKEYI